MLELTCACGWTAQGEEDDLYELTVEHGKNVHNMEVTRQQMLEMCRAV
jgi:predicted small metal-binding protein